MDGTRGARRQPRPYQLAALGRVKAANTIVCIPTGTGKTLIATMAIDHFLADRPGADVRARRAMFLVPTRVLVTQQAARCREFCAGVVRVAELSGMELEGWSSPQWRACLESHDILVGTPEVFRHALVDTGAITVTAFSLIVFDECHHTTGNSPMASICRDALWPAGNSGRCTPRILGLTASFVNGSLKDMEAKRAELEGLLQATLFCPDVPPEVAAGAASPDDSGLGGDKFREVAFEPDPLPPGAADLVRARVDEVVGAFEGATGVGVADVGKAVRRTVVVLEELGSDALCDAFRVSIVSQLEAAAEQRAAVFGRTGVGAATRAGLDRLSCILAAAADDLAADPHLCEIAPRVSRKARRLVELVGSLFREHAGDASYRGIIFVDQIALAAPLVRLLNSSFAGEPWQLSGALDARPVSGVGSMPDAQREQAMADFAAGRSRLLVCTAALEEGVDVSDCSFVVRFSHFATTRSHIQGAGRARRRGAEIFYFMNDAQVEEEGAMRMAAVARDATLALSGQELAARREAGVCVVEGVYPFHPTGGGPGEGGSEVNLFNCTPLVYEFCSKVLRDSFDPALLFEFDERGGGLDAVALPTPAGVVLVSRADADAHWGDIFVTDVTDPARRRGLSWADLDCMRLLYVAALKLHALGLLGHDNQPTPAALAETRAACPGFPREPRVRLRHRYDESPNSVDSSPSTMTPRTAALRGWPPADAVVRRLAETLPPFVTPPAAASAPPRAQNFDVARTIAARSAFPQSDTLAAPLNSGAPDSSVSMRNLERGSPTSHTPRSICVGTTQPFPFPISARSPAGTASPTAPPHECTPKSSPAATSTSDRSWPMPVSQPAHAASPLSMMGSSSVGHQSSYPMPYSGGLPRSLGIAAGDLDR